ncbi:MAG: LytTR family DNA-binding domain-containing protein [Burkholderiales bacterium]|jgi:two-component system response regulator AlgR|nr:LytTR family DNA-binding domain-containing protein [Burkholderiales bacterium]
MSSGGPGHPHALRVVIADDEAPARARLRELLDDCAQTLPLELVAEAANGQALLDCLPDARADVVLLDIRMPGMDGLEAAAHIGRLPDPPRIVFTTAYDAHAVAAFDLHAIDYLLKPIRLRRLFDALARVRSLTPLRLDVLRPTAPAARTHLSIPDRGRVHLVAVPDIVYLRAELKYVAVRTRERELLFEESLTRLEDEFGSRFLRIHRNCLVATSHLAGFERVADDGDGHWEAVLRGLDERLPVSRRHNVVVRAFQRGT